MPDCFDPCACTTRRRVLAVGAAVGWASISPRAVSRSLDVPEVAGLEALLPGARPLGQGTLRVWGLAVYEASLWVRPGFESVTWTMHPLALSLRYARDLRGEDIAVRSLDEMRRLQPIADAQAQRWLEDMRRAFPDVSAGDRVTGVWLPDVGNDASQPGPRSRAQVLSPRGHEQIDGPEFGMRFFALWMSPKGPKPRLRAALLGQAGASS